MKHVQSKILYMILLVSSLQIAANSQRIFIVNNGTNQNMSVIGRHKMNNGVGTWSAWHTMKNAAGKADVKISNNSSDLYNINLSADHEYACVLGDKYNWSPTTATYPLEYKGSSFAGQYAWVISGPKQKDKKLMSQNAVKVDKKLSKIVPLPVVAPVQIKSPVVPDQILTTDTLPAIGYGSPRRIEKIVHRSDYNSIKASDDSAV